MIDHVSVAVSDLERAGRFYDAALAPLGYRRMVERPRALAWGKRHPEVWANLREDFAGAPGGSGAHVCLRATSVEAVDAFHAAALAAGGRDEGAPGPRKAELVTYHGAFVADADGNRIEAMTVPRD